MDDLRLVNYVMLNNETPLNKWYFYFVIDKVYINERCTELILSIDVMQTYMFEYTFRESLIERMHYNRWTSDGSVNRKYHYLGDNIVNPASAVKSNEWVYSYENGRVYIQNSTKLPSGVYRDHIFSVDVNTKKARLCRTSFRQ